MNVLYDPLHMEKINTNKASVSSKSKVDEWIEGNSSFL